jgi:hypothetical protein
MTMRLIPTGGGVPIAPPPVIGAPIAGQGRLRKIALIGSAPTVNLAPWHDPTWEIWAHATVSRYCKRVDRYFDLHPWEWISKKPVPGYLEWLSKLTVPIYMQRRFQKVPASLRYPRERILAEYPRYFTSHAAWMVALALSEGVTHLGFFGIHYSMDEEHNKQRAGCEFWMGVAVGRGVQIVNPEGSPLLREPKWLYGYESHTGKTHVRETTGGKKPLSNTVDMGIPPQNIKIVGVDANVEAIFAAARTDVKLNKERLAQHLAFEPPMLYGQPAW